ncbi:MAG: glycosyltransferase [Nitrospiraceae bacterium]|nr:MAG: glycosyltransferase [Nitrospiraceae bacterium]
MAGDVIQPMVSVIVPTRDRLQFLKEAVQSIIDQTFGSFEIIVVDDGGEDVSGVLEEFRENRIRQIRCKASKGPAAARNRGLQAARGKYIAYLDDDDIYYPEHLETMVSFLESGACNVAYSDACRVNQENENGVYITKKKDIPYSFDFDGDLILLKNFIPTLCIVHERSCTDDVGEFDESLYTHEDWDLWIRMSRKFKFAHLRKVTCEYTRRRDSTSLTGEKRGDFLNTLKTIYSRYRKYVKDNPLLIEAQQRISGLMEAEIDFNYQVSTIEIKNKPETIDAAVSVIIPVICSNDRLKSLIAKIKSQKKVGDVEIILTSSAFTDSVMRVADEAGAGVVISGEGPEIKLTGYGARGDYLVCINQDAVPVSDYWLFNMLCPFFEYHQIAALSCRKFTRPDADLYSRWLNYSTEKSFEIERDYFVFPMRKVSKEVKREIIENITRKRLLFFENTALCFRRRDYDEIKTAVPVGKDDMLLGVELLKMGKAVGYLKSTGIYFDRQSGADYVFKRHYSNIKRYGVNQMFYFHMKGIGMDCLLASIMGLYEVIGVSLAVSGNAGLSPAAAIKSFLESMEQNLSIPPDKSGNTDNDKIIKDRPLDALLKEIVDDRVFSSDLKYDFRRNCITADFMRRFEDVAEYVFDNEQQLSEKEDDFAVCICKILAMTAGESLGAYYIEAEALNAVSGDLKRIDEILDKG